MKSVFEVQHTIRMFLFNVIENYSLEQLNKIPEGFSNNLIWNIGHCISTQQNLVYKLSGLPTLVSEEFIVKYKKGTKPEGDVLLEEVEEIRNLLLSTFLQTEKDFEANIFVNFNEYLTSMDLKLKNIHEALDYNNFHEGIHLGMIMLIKKFV